MSLINNKRTRFRESSLYLFGLGLVATRQGQPQTKKKANLAVGLLIPPSGFEPLLRE